MIFYIYSVYDPEVGSFDSRLNLGPLGPEEMAEQYRRAHIKMKPEEKGFVEGKKAILMGTFDDEEGKITQGNLVEVYHFLAKKFDKEQKGEREEGENAEKV